MANVPITSLPEATAPSANDYLILQGENTQRIKWSTLLDKLYPVGCIYQSASSTSPASLFGGTWERIKDRFILAAGDTYAAGSTGGEAQHALTEPEMPRHSHPEQIGDKSIPSQIVNALMKVEDGGTKSGVILEADWKPTGLGADVRTNYAGNSKAHNNMPPYIVMYVWKRIA